MSKFVLFLITTLFAFLFPVILALIWRKKTNCNIIAFIIGVIIFTLFVNGLESFAHYYFMSVNEKTSLFINSNPIVYALYGALMAGLFEETGRLVGFKVLLSKHNTKETSVGYGIGHAGIECILTLGITYLLYTVVLAGGSYGDPSIDALILQTIDQIDTAMVPFAILERVIAMCTHIGLSILVFKACHNKNSFYLFFIAIGLHFITDMPAGLYQAGILTSIPLVEMLSLVISLAILYFGIKTYKSLEDN